MYIKILWVISVFSFIIPAWFYWRSVKKIERKTNNSFFVWKIMHTIGCIGISISIFFIGKSIDMIYISRNNPVLGFILLPLTLALFLYFVVIFFTQHINKTDINCYKSKNIEKTVDILKTRFFPAVNKNLYIVSGNFNPHFYGHEDIIKSLNQLQNRGIDIQIIFSFPYEVEYNNKEMQDAMRAKEITKTLLTDKYKLLKQSFFCLPHRYNGHHFMVTDGLHIRIEERHEPWWKRPSPVEGTKGWFYFWTPIFAWRLNCTFRILKMKTRLLEIWK